MTVHHFHQQALVEANSVGSNTSVMAFTRLCPQAEIGRRCQIGNHCCIENHAWIGDDVIINHGTLVASHVRIEKKARLGLRVTFIHEVARRTMIDREQRPPTLIREGAQLGDGVTVRCGVTVGRYAQVAPGSEVTVDVPDFARASGRPARRRGWVCVCGERLKLPRKGDGETTCSCGLTFKLADGQVIGAEGI